MRCLQYQIQLAALAASCVAATAATALADLERVAVVKCDSNAGESGDEGCRDTLQRAIDKVDERETVQASLCSQAEMKNEFGLSLGGTTDWLEHAYCFQTRKCTSDDDPYQNDYLTRLIEMLPPSTFDDRIS
jgi:hypothetical protein